MYYKTANILVLLLYCLSQVHTIGMELLSERDIGTDKLRAKATKSAKMVPNGVIKPP